MTRLVIAFLFSLVSAGVVAQPYPSKPIRFVVPFPPGNAGDLMARMLAEKMTAAMGQSIIVDNRPGAGGNIGAEHAAKSPADGYTVLIAASGIVTANAFLYKLAYDPLKDLAPITLIYSGAPVLVVSPKVEAKDLRELIDYAKKNPGKRLRPLGVVSAKRNPKMPDVPAIAEVLPGFEVTGWLGAFVPAGAPHEIVVRLNREMVSAIKAPEFLKRLDELMLDPGGDSPEHFAAYVRANYERVGAVIRSANIKAD